MKPSRSFTARLTSRILVITTILYIVAMGVVSFFTISSIVDEATKSANHVLMATQLQIENNLDKVEIISKNTSWFAKQCAKDSMKLYAITNQVLVMNEPIIGCAIALDSSFSGQKFLSPYSYRDENLKIHSIELGNEQYNYYEKEWYKEAMSTKKARWCKPYYDEGGGEQLMTTYSIPLLDNNGKPFGIVTADLSLIDMSIAIQNTKPYENAYSVLVDKDGNIIADGRYSSLRENYNVDSLALNENLLKEMKAGHTGTLRYNDHNEFVFTTYGPISNGWSVAVVCPEKDVFAHSIAMNKIFFVVTVLSMLLLVMFSARLIKRLLQPVTELSVSALNMAKGNFTARLPEIKTKDELRKLHDSMSYMQSSIISYISELKTTTASNERMESELNIARNIQLGMVPHNFPPNMYATLKPAREVGGDLYDFFIKDRSLYFAIGDVSGKGVPAALFMAVTRAAFRFIANMGLPIAEVVEKINDSLSESNESNMFVTLFVGCLDLDTGLLRFCNGGHNPIVVIPPADSPNPHAYFLKVEPNLAAGLMPGFKYKADEIQLAKNSRILLYTDGISEAETEQQDLFGDDRLLAWAESQVGTVEAPVTMVESLLNKLTQFTDGADQNDDITAMVITIK